jgi:hypothetical protein
MQTKYSTQTYSSRFAEDLSKARLSVATSLSQSGLASDRTRLLYRVRQGYPSSGDNLHTL